MSDQRKAYLYAGAVIVIWSTVASAFKISLRYLDALQLLLIASLSSLVVLFLILLVQKKLPLLFTASARQYGSSALLGFLNPFLYYHILFRAYELLPAQEAQPLNQTWAIVLAILSIVLLRQRIRWQSIVALLISFIGVIIIASQGAVFRFHFTDIRGVLLALGSAWVWAFFWTFNIKDTRDEVVKLFLNFGAGSIFILSYVLLQGGMTLPDWQGLLGGFYVGVFEMGITFVLWLRALRLSRTTVRVSILIYVVPFLSLGVIHLTVGEHILLSTVIGLIFIVGGIFFERFYAQKHLPEQAGPSPTP